MKVRCWAIVSGLALSLLLVAGAPVCGQQLAIKGGRVIPVAGKPIEDGVILIRDGKISAVGVGLAIPLEAKEIDASGKTIMPGFVDAHSPAAMSQANERNPNVPFLSVVDSIDPIREFFEESRRNGVTTVAVVPGNSTMIGGQAAIIKTAGSYVDDMILKRHAGIKISLLPTSGASRMSHLAKLRKELEKARRALKDGDAKEAPAEDAGDKAESDKNDPEKKDGEGPDQENTDQGKTEASKSDASQQLEAMKKLLAGEFPAFIYCGTAMDAIHALQLTRQYELKTILVTGRDCYRAVDQIAASKLPVILDSTLVFWRTDPRSGDDEKIVLPKIFFEKKVPVAFQVSQSSSSTLGSSYLWYQAATAVKYGMPVDEALSAITLRPAEMLGVAEFVGSIAPGKDADLVILSGEPLKVGTWVEKTIVNGRVVYEREKDEKLQKLLQPDKQP